MKFRVVIIACLFAMESQLIAAPVVVQYEATIETVDDSFLGYTITRLTPVTGSFLFDTSITTDSFSITSDINRGWYKHSGNGGFTASFQALDGTTPVNVSIAGSGSPEVRVEWFPSSNDTWRYLDGMPNYGTMIVNGVPNSDVDLGFAMTETVLFASDANTNPWPLVTFTGGLGDTPHTFALSDPNGTILLQINNFVVIPEPASWAIALPVMVGGWLARRGNRHG